MANYSIWTPGYGYQV